MVKNVIARVLVICDFKIYYISEMVIFAFDYRTQVFSVFPLN